MAAAYLAHSQRDQTVLDLPFGMAVFICAALVPPKVMLETERSNSIASFGEISIPTVSIIGKRDLCYN